jgi:hypothetical protein
MAKPTPIVKEFPEIAYQVKRKTAGEVDLSGCR